MTTVFRKAQSNISIEKLREIISKNSEYLQSGLRVIDLKLILPELEFLGFLGINKNKQISIIAFDTDDSNNEVLISALSQAQWLKENKNLVKRLFNIEDMDFSYPFQIILIGQGFSEKLRRVMKLLSGINIKFIQFKYVVDASQDAIIFEEIFCNNPEQELTECIDGKSLDIALDDNNPVSKKARKEIFSRADEIALTSEEIAEFMNFDKTLKND